MVFFGKGETRYFSRRKRVSNFGRARFVPTEDIKGRSLETNSPGDCEHSRPLQRAKRKMTKKSTTIVYKSTRATGVCLPPIKYVALGKKSHHVTALTPRKGSTLDRRILHIQYIHCNSSPSNITSSTNIITYYHNVVGTF